jgi:diguanylate cyclase (GGDEF)-like protein
VECSQRYQRPLSLLIIDIDNFKDINDKYGHICGDEIVRQFGSMLKINVRTSDILARFGGDEFAVIMPETNSEKALLAAQKYAKICNECIFTFGQENIQITISIGLAEMMHQEDLKPEELIHKADHAMYQAKNCGRNQIVVYKG